MEHRRLLALGETTAVQIWHDTQTQWLYVRWRGTYAEPLADEGWAFLLRCLHEHPCTKVLNDARYATAGWAGREHWVGNTLFPQLAQHGVHHVACLYPKALAARASLTIALEHSRHPFMAAFEDLATAYAWLLRK